MKRPRELLYPPGATIDEAIDAEVGMQMLDAGMCVEVQVPLHWVVPMLEDRRSVLVYLDSPPAGRRTAAPKRADQMKKRM